MKLLYYLPAIGDPDLGIKEAILLHNLNYIYKNIMQPFSLLINFYTHSESIKAAVRGLGFIEQFYISERKGVLTELFLRNSDNIHVSEFDYVLFVLDDVKIVELDLPKMIDIKTKHGLEILSPRILKSTHSYMNNGRSLTIHNFLEIYLILMTPKDFNRFCSIHTIENKWMWGVDLLFGYYKITAGVIHNYSASHELPSKTLSNPKLVAEACNLSNRYLQERTVYKNFREIMASCSAVSATIDPI